MGVLSPVIVAVVLICATSVVAIFFWTRKGASKVQTIAKKPVSLQPEKEYHGSISILFGTQTGTAERFGKQLKTELQQRYGDDMAYNVIDIEEYEHEDKLPQERLVFLMLATYGDGEPTDNAATFFDWVTAAGNEAKKGQGQKLLQGLTFGIFGLGNRQYEHFCAVGKRVRSAMLDLGASAIIENGEGDDDEDIEADYDKWREQLYQICDNHPLIYKSAAAKGVSNVMEVTAAGAVPSFEVELCSDPETCSSAQSMTWSGDGSSVHQPFPAAVTMNRELHTPDSERSCLHLELDFTGSQASYEAGDHIGILPENEQSVVERAASCLGLSPETVFSLQMPPGNAHGLTLPFTGPISLRNALAWYTDLVSPVNKTQIQALAAFAEKEDGARLRHLLSPEGNEDYKQWQAQSRSLLEVLEEFTSVKIPLGAFFGAIAGRLQVRFYSISSSPKVQPSSVHVTCALVSHPTSTGRQHNGVASHQLKRASTAMRIPAYIRKSTFKLPSDACTPLIMIGPGTGLAPFRGFLQERAALAASGKKLGPAHLFFGCRNSKHDYIYEAELADLRAQGGYTHLHTAFSREGPSKVYVQHRIEQHAATVWPLIEQGGYVYVCGEAKNMAKDVHKVLLKLADQSQVGGEKFMQQLSSSGRYQKDVW